MEADDVQALGWGVLEQARRVRADHGGGDRVAFKAFAGMGRRKLEITDGVHILLVYGEDDLNDRRRGACGSLLFSVVRDGDLPQADEL